MSAERIGSGSSSSTASWAVGARPPTPPEDAAAPPSRSSAGASMRPSAEQVAACVLEGSTRSPTTIGMTTLRTLAARSSACGSASSSYSRARKSMKAARKVGDMSAAACSEHCLSSSVLGGSTEAITCLTSSVSACLGMSCRKAVTQPSACARCRSCASTFSRVSLETASTRRPSTAPHILRTSPSRALLAIQSGSRWSSERSNSHAAPERSSPRPASAAAAESAPTSRWLGQPKGVSGIAETSVAAACACACTASSAFSRSLGCSSAMAWAAMSCCSACSSRGARRLGKARARAKRQWHAASRTARLGWRCSEDRGRSPPRSWSRASAATSRSCCSSWASSLSEQRTTASEEALVVAERARAVAIATWPRSERVSPSPARSTCVMYVCGGRFSWFCAREPSSASRNRPACLSRSGRFIERSSRTAARVMPARTSRVAPARAKGAISAAVTASIAEPAALPPAEVAPLPLSALLEPPNLKPPSLMPLLAAGLGASLPASFFPSLYGASSAASERSPSAAAAAARTGCSGSSRLLTHSVVSCSTRSPCHSCSA
mmetsp:Transcript_2693/g.7024  ORF Transcript_2693/g.7024 Transcript_2693/m.7024 type:complete len:552 (-) Transcript_2693:297-1952(-)